MVIEEMTEGTVLMLIVVSIFIVIFIALVLQAGRCVYEFNKGKKCSYCKRRSIEWLKWHQMDKKTYEGWIWCPGCSHAKWKGFQDRVFG